MRRWDTGRDGWLTARMILVCAALALAYAAFVAASVVLVVVGWDTSPLFVFVPAIVAILLLVHFTLADLLVVASARARLVTRREEPEFWLLSPVRWVLLGFGSALTLALSRYREYAADRGAANLTGAPEQLMSALEELDGGARRIPRADLRRVTSAEAFFIVPVRRRAVEVRSDHPPLEKRLARLSEIARELGEPVAV